MRELFFVVIFGLISNCYAGEKTTVLIDQGLAIKDGQTVPLNSLIHRDLYTPSCKPKHAVAFLSMTVRADGPSYVAFMRAEFDGFRWNTTMDHLNLDDHRQEHESLLNNIDKSLATHSWVYFSI